MGLLDIAIALTVMLPMAALYTVFTEPMLLLGVIAVGLVVFIIRAKVKEREQERIRSFFPDDFKF